jgi:hypothetical protein
MKLHGLGAEIGGFALVHPFEEPVNVTLDRGIAVTPALFAGNLAITVFSGGMS